MRPTGTREVDVLRGCARARRRARSSASRARATRRARRTRGSRERARRSASRGCASTSRGRALRRRCGRRCGRRRDRGRSGDRRRGSSRRRARPRARCEPVSTSARRLREQALGVARVQADRRLVEHVERAGEAAAELRGEAQALHLAAGERARRAIEREVAEARPRSTNSSRRTSSRERRLGDAARASPVKRQRSHARERARRPSARRPRGSARPSRRTRARERREARSRRRRGTARVLALVERASAPPSTPVPSHASQRPCFVLNENQRGSSSGTPVPHAGTRASVESSARLGAVVGAHLARAPLPQRERAVERRALERRRAARRRRRDRSCAPWSSRARGGSSVDDQLAVDAARSVTPARAAAVKTSRYVPLRARDRGREQRARCPSIARARAKSCVRRASARWARRSSGSAASPTFAKSSRR